MASRVLLIRHGSVRPEFVGRLNGRRDIPLAATYRAELSLAVPILKGERPGVIFSSPQARALTCAELLAEQIQRPLISDDHLMEMDLGDWEGKTLSELEELDGDMVRRFRQWDPTFVVPGGESVSHFVSRVSAACRLLCSRRESTVVAVTHSGVIRQMICHYLGLSPTKYLLFDIQCGKVAALDVFGDRGVLVGLNLASANG